MIYFCKKKKQIAVVYVLFKKKLDEYTIIDMADSEEQDGTEAFLFMYFYKGDILHDVILFLDS